MTGVFLPPDMKYSVGSTYRNFQLVTEVQIVYDLYQSSHGAWWRNLDPQQVSNGTAAEIRNKTAQDDYRPNMQKWDMLVEEKQKIVCSI